MKARQLFDCFTFFNELDLLDLRLKTLDQSVTSFVLVESTRTFSGERKELYFERSKARFAPYLDRITHIVVDDMPNSDNPWELEAHQRDAIGRGLGSARPDDLILVSDVDEILKPTQLEWALKAISGSILVFGLEEYNFKLNLRVGQPTGSWLGPRMIEKRYFRSGELLRRVRGIKSKSLPQSIEALSWQVDVFRSHGAWLKRRLVPNGAWHFSFVMDDEAITQKLRSYSHQENATSENLQPGLGTKRVAECRSFLGHNLETADLKQLPRPVQQDPMRWSHLLHALPSHNQTALAS